jgi:hypothetical protein
MKSPNREGHMTESTLDPIDDFVRQVRTIAADNQHVIVGSASIGPGGNNHYLIEVAVAAIDPTPNRPFTTAVWSFEVTPAGDESTVLSAWDTWHFLVGLLRRDFQTVKEFGNELDFARAVERRWPCPEATAARERFAVKHRGRQEWEERRSSYIAKRQREGATYGKAYMEFLKADPPNY